jgi:integrase
VGDSRQTQTRTLDLDSLETRRVDDTGAVMLADEALFAAHHPGETFGRYVLLRPLGAGGMSVVWVAYDPELDRSVALKLMHDRDTNRFGSGSQRLLREAQALARLSHANVVRVFDVGLVAGEVYLAMELVEGVTLREWMVQTRHGAREILRVLTRAGRGLAAAHDAGLVHLDFKPTNVLVGVDGEVRVVDFGLARDPAQLAARSSGDSGSSCDDGPRSGRPATRLGERVSRETVRKELVLLRSALRTAHFVGHAVPDLLLLFPKLAAHYVPRQRWLTPDQFFALAELLPPHRRRYLYVACYTGGRRSELAALQWGDIDWTRETVHLRGTKTDQAARHVPLHPHLGAFLRQEFVHAEGRVLQRWPNVCRDLATRCEQLAIPPVTPNDLRRTFGSWLVQQNVSAHIVAKLMGHTTEKMVNMVYGHLDDQALRRAVDQLPSPK